MSIEQDQKRYRDAAHAMQSGVAYEMQSAPDEAATTPKHLRAGINSAMATQAGLATLLMEKGIFTLEEYTKAMADAMEKERDRYQAKLPEHVVLV